MKEKGAVDVSRFLHPYKPPRTDLVAAARYWAAETPNNPAFLFTDGEDGQDQKISYSELDQAARAIAARLQEDGAEGERVLLLYPPGLDFVTGFFGCLYAGAIAVPAFPPRKNRKGARIQGIAEDCTASWALSVTSVCELIRSDESARQDLAGAKILATDQVELSWADHYDDTQIDSSAPAVLQYTSGSTGQPKGVVLTHACLVRNSELIMMAFEPTRDGIGLSWLPTYHDMGLVGGVLEPLCLGRPSILMSPMSFLQRPSRWLRSITRHGVTISGGPNFAYQLCVDKITDEEMKDFDLSRWSVAFNGAEPVRSTTLRDFAKKFAPVGFRSEAFLPCYGMAETTLIVTGGPSNSGAVLKNFDSKKLDQHQVVPATSGSDSARELVGCGRILPEERLIIVDPDTHRICADDRVGEIWVQSPSVGNGYWKKPEQSAEVFGAKTEDGQGPFLRTGDLGFVHANQLFVAGRLKDMIIVRGVNRYPQDIEQTVELCHPAIQTGAVAAFADNIQERERLVITAEVQRGRQEDWDEVIQSIRRRVTEVHELPPEAIVLVRFGTLPKTSSGKIQRHAAQQDFAADQLNVVAQWKLWEVQLPRQEPMIAASTAHSPRSNGNGSIKQLLGTNNSKKSPDPDAEVVKAVIAAAKLVAQERAESVTIDTNIVLDLGLDSLERLQIAQILEQTYGGRFPEEVLQEVETVREVAVAIETHFGKERVHRSLTEAVAIEEVLPHREVTAEDYQFDHLPEYRRLKQTMAQFLLTGVPNPYFAQHQGVVRDTTTIDGRELISFASYNYLGMSGDPTVNEAVVEAVSKYGTSCSASRLVSGEKDLHRELELALARWIGTEDSIVLVGGHATNESVIGHLLRPGDLILHDSLSHNSIIQGAILSGARRRSFPHNDWKALDRILSEVRNRYRRVLVIVEGVYSMDGDYPELPKFIEVKQRHKAWLMVDEAHSIGTMGAHGRGIGEHFAVDAKQVDVWMGTLSKSFGTCGGYISGSKELIEYLKYTTPGFVFSVGLSPPNTAAALASLHLLEAEPQRVAKLHENSNLFLTEAKKRGLNTGDSRDTAVVPVITGNSLVALQLARRMYEKGVNVLPILYPAVEESAARLRFFINSTHSREQIMYAVQQVEENLLDLYPQYFGQRKRADLTVGAKS